ncbi:HNH endonuclease signature motif containing protein [Brachybacterium vulturis]|uniref:HNH endonuclease signature motif containing protein n=1 Tax=Brachybacterium vulturis TaxID=2017484 RepID=UPI001FE4EB6F|nr:HNH endonuclease signature motif containing protein [Brachybacterium vulturis]
MGRHAGPSAIPPGPERSASRPDEPPRKPVQSRTPLTAQALVDRADVTPHTPEAETVLRIFHRRRQEHAAFYVAETRDLATLWSEEDEGDEKALHALAASVGMRAKLHRGEDRLRDAHVAVTDLPACFGRVESGALPVEWFEWLIRSVLHLTAYQRRQVDERVAAWQLESIDVERFYRELHTLVVWFGRAAVQESPQEQRSVSLASSPDSDGTACLMIRGPIPEITAFGQRLDAAARAVQDAQRHALETGAPIPFDLDGDASREGRHLSLAALQYAIAVRSQLDTGAVEVPDPAFRISVVVPVLTLLGRSNAPATLDGTIPIPPRMARELVAKAPAFERVLTDPVSGDHLPSASRTYRPSAAMAENLRLIDPVCAVPGCTRNVMTVGEMDHIEEFDLENPARGGPTSVENLHRICRTHHRMKTAGLLDPERDETTGTTRWRILGAAVCDVAANTDLVTRELGGRLREAWQRYADDLEFEALTRTGFFDEARAEDADRDEAYRWGCHLIDHYSRPEHDEADDPGPPPLPPPPGHEPPPY